MNSFLKQILNTSLESKVYEQNRHIHFFNWFKKLHWHFSKLQNVPIYYSYTYSRSVSLLTQFPPILSCVQRRTGQVCLHTCFSTPAKCPAFSNNIVRCWNHTKTFIWHLLYLKWGILPSCPSSGNTTAPVLLSLRMKFSFRHSANYAKVSHRSCWIKGGWRAWLQQAWLQPLFTLEI